MTLVSIFNSVGGDLIKFSNILVSIQQVINQIDAHVTPDASFKDEAIDEIIKLLQSKKSSGTS